MPLQSRRAEQLGITVLDQGGQGFTISAGRLALFRWNGELQDWLVRSRIQAVSPAQEECLRQMTSFRALEQATWQLPEVCPTTSFLTRPWIDFVRNALNSRKNIAVVGAPLAGKTTLLGQIARLTVGAEYFFLDGADSPSDLRILLASSSPVAFTLAGTKIADARGGLGGLAAQDGCRGVPAGEIERLCQLTLVVTKLGAKRRITAADEVTQFRTGREQDED